ncbi:hypothetical protein [Anabaena sp. UHCC 0451]|uniref:hypothetical protein n=1 Tax=Anabaena sp. UHCC 0451 TaxID=2055235 RepID=UPI002B214AEF|nr:hypothetical protein [Anabaena sp. UHCC 0451]MEA5579545.1 hypothetical protein [Anabaena sp. UHCC 0451]
MTEIPKSLLPYDKEYVLIHKRTLLVNTATLSGMVEFIAQKMNWNSDDVAAMFGIAADNVFNEMTDEQVSRRADFIVSTCWQLNQKSVVVQVDNPPGEE